MIPAFTIVIGEEDLTKLYRDRLISLDITDNSTEQADQLNIELSDHDRKIMFPKQGTVISVGHLFEWNSFKSEINLVKHSISFEEAAQSFGDEKGICSFRFDSQP